MEELAAAERARDWYVALGGVKAAHDVKVGAPQGPRSPQAITQRLIEIVWWYTFRHYFWLTQERRKTAARGWGALNPVDRSDEIRWSLEKSVFDQSWV